MKRHWCLGLIFIAFLFAVSVKAENQTSNYTFNTNPQILWQNTGIQLNAGEHLTFTASGIVFFSSGLEYPTGPNGSGASIPWTGFPCTAKENRAYYLMGKIGNDGPCFYIGEDLEMNVEQTGTLFLGTNDGILGDNSGSWQVLIQQTVLAGNKSNQSNESPLLFYCRFDGTTTCENGEVPLRANATTFENGRFGQGIRIDTDDVLSYPREQNFRKQQGTVLMWVKTDWAGGNVAEVRPFFAYVDNGYVTDALRFGKGNNPPVGPDGGGISYYESGGPDHGQGFWFNQSVWPAGMWRHIAASWDASTGELHTYLDGELREENPYNLGIPLNLDPVIGPEILLGTSYEYSLNNRPEWRLQGVMDEVRIYDHALSPEEIHLLYLADIANESNVTNQTPKINLLQNPSFEDSAISYKAISGYWDTSSKTFHRWGKTAQISRISNTELDGQWAMKIDDKLRASKRSRTDAAIVQYLEVNSPNMTNKTWNLSANIKWMSGDAPILQLEFLKSNKNRLAIYSATPTNGRGSGVWQNLSISHTAPSGAAYVKVILYSCPRCVSKAAWDNIFLEAI